MGAMLNPSLTCAAQTGSETHRQGPLDQAQEPPWCRVGIPNQSRYAPRGCWMMSGDTQRVTAERRVLLASSRRLLILQRTGWHHSKD